MLAKHEAVSDGDALLDYVNVKDLPSAWRGTAMMFQSYALFPHLTVAENVAFAMKMKGVPKEKRLTEAATVRCHAFWNVWRCERKTALAHLG